MATDFKPVTCGKRMSTEHQPCGEESMKRSVVTTCTELARKRAIAAISATPDDWTGKAATIWAAAAVELKLDRYISGGKAVAVELKLDRYKPSVARPTTPRGFGRSFRPVGADPSACRSSERRRRACPDWRACRSRNSTRG